MLASQLVSLQPGQRVEWTGPGRIGGWVLVNDEQVLVVGWDDGRAATLVYRNGAGALLEFASHLERGNVVPPLIEGPAPEGEGER